MPHTHALHRNALTRMRSWGQIEGADTMSQPEWHHELQLCAAECHRMAACSTFVATLGREGGWAECTYYSACSEPEPVSAEVCHQKGVRTTRGVSWLWGPARALAGRVRPVAT